MTAAEPIDLEIFKVEEDIYGDPVKTEPRQETVFEFETPTKPGKGGKGSQKGSPYDRPANRRPPESADVEDRALVTCVDSGMDWNEIMRQFPGISKSGLQKRYRKKKAQLEPWNREDDSVLSRLSKQYDDEKWKIIASKMKRQVESVSYRAKKLALS